MTTTPACSNQIPAVASVAAGAANPREVLEWLRAGEAVLVDVREPDEHARERIEGARLLPLSRFDPAEASALLKPGQRLVFHCRSGGRSVDACRRAAVLAQHGVAVVELSGGIEAWKRASLPVAVDTSVARLSIMRQVQLVVGLGVLAGSGLAWFVHPAFLALPAFFGAGLTFAGATGVCGLASVLGAMPWNSAARAGACERTCCG